MKSNGNLAGWLIVIVLFLPIFLMYYIVKWLAIGIAALFALIAGSRNSKDANFDSVEAKYTTTPATQRMRTPTPQSNHLPAGVYVIGQDIPANTYDFHLIWGNGSIHKYVDETTTLGANNYFGWAGANHEYERQDFINVHCANGERLYIDGNLILAISKSERMKLDL